MNFLNFEDLEQHLYHSFLFSLFQLKSIVRSLGEFKNRSSSNFPILLWPKKAYIKLSHFAKVSTFSSAR